MIVMPAIAIFSHFLQQSKSFFISFYLHISLFLHTHFIETLSQKNNYLVVTYVSILCILCVLYVHRFLYFFLSQRQSRKI